MKEVEKIKQKDYSRQRLTNEEYLRRIKNIYGDNITVLEPYVNQRTKILHRCNIHNYEWPARTKQMMEGHNGCKYCSSEKRTKGLTSDIDEVKKKVKEKCGNEFIVN